MPQSQETRTSTHEEEPVTVTPEQAEKIGEQAARSAELSAETDEVVGKIDDVLLDEIADVLENNAEEFVQAYVQRGGQ